MKIEPVVLLNNIIGFLQRVRIGETFCFKGSKSVYEFYDENKDFYFIKETLSKQEILIKKM